MSRPRITLDQWLVFQTVVDEGSFANAAEKLRRSQSTVSYNIRQLENMLDIKLFAISGRKALLTERGRQILLKARQITQTALALEQEASNLNTVAEQEITIVFDAILPRSILLAVLDDFDKLKLPTRLILREAALSGTIELFNQAQAGVAIVTKVPSEMIGKKIMEVESVAYAHPSHYLHQLNRPLNEFDLQKQKQIVLMDSAKNSNRDEGWLGSQAVCNVDSINLKIDLVAQGSGFAWLPKRLVEERKLTLKPLPLEVGARRFFSLFLITKPQSRDKLACSNIITLFEKHC